MNGSAPVITMDDGQGNKNVIKSKNFINYNEEFKS